jgi:hypothetical protein
MNDEELRRFLGAVEKVRGERAGVVDGQTRDEVARELGVTDEELAAARARAEDDLSRGLGCLQHGLWDEALRWLDEADALLPDDPRVLHARARAFFERHRAGGGKADRERARALTRRCLELDPRHAPSYALLRDLSGGAGGRLLKGALILAVGGAVAYGAAVVPLRARPTAPAPGLAPVVADGTVGKRAFGCQDASPYCELPADVQLGDGLDGVTLEPARFRLSRDKLRLELSGRVTHQGATELEELPLQVELLAQDGSPLGEVGVAAQPGFLPPLRPGDSRTFHLGEEVPAGTRSARVSGGPRRTRPAPPTYGAGQSIALTAEPALPSHVVLATAFRERNVRRHAGKTTVEGVLEATNDGAGVIRQLELELRALDAAGAQLGNAARLTVAYPHMPPMGPGERRTVRVFLHVTGEVANEVLAVTTLK